MAAVTSYSFQSELHPFSNERNQGYANSLNGRSDSSKSRHSNGENYPSRSNGHHIPNESSKHDEPSTASLGSSEDIIDVRRDKSSPIDLRTQTLEALSAPEGRKSLPSLLVWSEKGQKRFHEVIFGEDYYPFLVENNLVNKYADSIASRIVSSGSTVLVELGAGSMQKTGRLLAALDALNWPVTYYALDVDRLGLATSIQEIRSRQTLRNITLRGLQGTYEDGAVWLATAPEVRDSSQSFIWLGASMGNCSSPEASNLLKMFTQKHSANRYPNFVIAVDGCMERERLERAYDSPTGSNRRFIKSAISRGAEVLGSEAEQLLNDSKWAVAGGWNAASRQYESFLQPLEDLSATVDGREIKIGKQTRLPVISSRKWNRMDIQKICVLPGLKAEKAWADEAIDYGIYWLDRA